MRIPHEVRGGPCVRHVASSIMLAVSVVPVRSPVRAGWGSGNTADGTTNLGSSPPSSAAGNRPMGRR
jgi:hypothetical protein